MRTTVNFYRSLVPAGCLTLAAALGCDFSGQYEQRFQEALQSSAARAAFDQQLFPTETPVTDPSRKETGVKLRIPILFKDSKSLPATDPRAEPPFLKLPGLHYAMERELDDGTNKNFLPTYVYFAAVPKIEQKVEQKADALQAALAQQLAAAFPGAAWADVQVPTPEGKPITLKRIRVEGQQDFYNIQAKKTDRVDGRFDLYFINSRDHHVLLGWRTPKPQGTRYFYAASDAAMGTVTSNAGTAPAGGSPDGGKKSGG